MGRIKGKSGWVWVEQALFACLGTLLGLAFVQVGVPADPYHATAGMKGCSLPGDGGSL